MSVINKMLKSLDERNAPSTAKTVLQQELRAAKRAPKPSRRALPIAAAVTAVLAGAYWVGLRPAMQTQRQAQELSAQLPAAAPTKPPASAPASAVAAPTSPAPTATPAVAQAPEPPAPAPRAPEPVAVAAPAPVPPPVVTARPPAPPSAVPSTRAKQPEQLAMVAPKHVGEPVSRPPRSPAPTSAAESAPARARDEAGAAAKPEKKNKITIRSKTESDFAAAVSLLDQGRVDEALFGMRAVLKSDPNHLAARQTVVALLIEQKRLAEARAEVADALQVAPGNAMLAVTLARLTLDGGDHVGALDVLKRYAAAGASSPEYRGFAAALLHRAGSYAEAIEEYAAAIQLAPHHGPFWVGMATAQQSLGRNAEALQALQRAKASGTLGPELVAVVDQRMRQLGKVN